MTARNHLEDHLVQLGQAFGDEARFVSQVMDRIDRGEHLARLRHFHRRRLIVKSTIAASLSTAAVIVMAVFFGGPDSLYASAIGMLDKARTAHVVAVSLMPDRPKEEVEVWYDRDKGTAMVTGPSDKPEHTQIDDGKAIWRFRPGDKTVVKSPSGKGPKAWIAQLIDPGQIKAKQTRLSSYDACIGDENCLAYVWTPEEVSLGENRIVVLVDHEGRFRRLIHETLDHGQYVAKMRIDLTFDIAVDPSRFIVPSGPGYQVVTVRDVLKGQFSLDNAIFTEEALGHVFAIHEIKRTERGVVYVLSSLRPAKTPNQGGPAEGVKSSINLQPNGFDSFKDAYQQKLATFNAEDPCMEVIWWVHIPRGEAAEVQAKASGQVKLRAEITMYEGKQFIRKLIEPVIEIPPADSVLPLEQISRQVHNQALSLESVARYVAMNLMLEQHLPEHGSTINGLWERTALPSRISAVDFAREVTSLVDFYRRMGNGEKYWDFLPPPKRK